MYHYKLYVWAFKRGVSHDRGPLTVLNVLSPTPPNPYFSRLGGETPNYVRRYFIRLEKDVSKSVWVNLSWLKAIVEGRGYL